ncbi:hypothetical protein E1B28_010070 [Marasmius oreades]|uniref:Asl1-like glycosyl hydrolase catalytic domain-containing protein n=1 Tax=Marasmius oreades TaxID=181124 RepID=A0A9P7RWK4_9AGAR|nr:uncharacterized protein E1B28_010070 [Marasmius oreades]KAG7091005.1 hypothetical protein E1B28_010070 [Marasmius oreades]
MPFTTSLFHFKLFYYFCLLKLVTTLPSIHGSPGLHPRSAAVTNVSKAGLAWPNGDGDDIDQYTSTGKVSWYYSWSPKTWIKTDIQYVPMLWGQRQVEEFSSTINQTISEINISHVLGMNEPQEKGQSNLTPQQGADMWKTYLEPLRSRGIRLGSPAPSSAPSGKIWLQDFLTACGDGCTVDFIALHYYDVNATDFVRYLTDHHNTFQRPIWVTEWACQNFNQANKQCSQDDIVLFLNKTQSFMDRTDWVERYSWFGSMRDMQGVNSDNALMGHDGKITNLGLQYIGAKNATTSGSGNADGPNAPGGRENSCSSTKTHTFFSVVIMVFSTLWLQRVA